MFKYKNIIIYGFVSSVILVLLFLLSFFTNSTYNAVKKNIRHEEKINGREVSTIRPNLNRDDNDTSFYIVDVYFKHQGSQEIFIKLNNKNMQIIKYVYIIDDTDRCYYYGIINHKYACK